MPDITEAQLRQIMPKAPPLGLWVGALNAGMARFKVDSGPRVAAFLAQVAHESMELQHMVENLSYSASRLTLVWPNRFPTIDVAQPYERQPEKLANYVYSKRLGNGDPASGDGWRFRGRGILQITGRGNYARCGQALGIDLEATPERLEAPDVAALAAAQFWDSHGLNVLADDRNDDNDDEDFVQITQIINGGRSGLAARRAYWEVAKAALV